MYRIDVALSPQENLPGLDCWLVVDLLRASSQIVTFFSLGGGRLFAVDSVRQALDLKNELGDACLLLGERGGVPPEGFDRGNSPSELKKQTLGGRSIGCISTSNGTGALLRAAQYGKHILVAGLLNVTHCSELALSLGRRIGVLCAGNGGRSMLDDTLCAGALVDQMCSLLNRQGVSAVLSDSAQMARSLYRVHSAALLDAVKRSEHAQFLISKGFEHDIDYCCQKDLLAITPRMVECEGRVVLCCDSREQKPLKGGLIC